MCIDNDAAALAAWRAAQVAYHQQQEPPKRLAINVCADGGLLCEDCVKNEAERIADVDPRCPDDDQWRVIGQQEVTFGDRCDQCGKVYGEPIEEDF